MSLKSKRSFIIYLSLMTVLGFLPYLFAGEPAAGAKAEEIPSFVKFICAITFQEPGCPADFVVFLGRFHPLVLHLPIGILVLTFMMELFAAWKKLDLNLAGVFALGFGSVNAWCAVFLGALLSTTNNYGADLINRHGWLGMLFAASFTVAFFIKFKGYKKNAAEMNNKPVIGALSVSLLLMSIVGHDGGSLTHGPEYLFDHAPNFVRTMTGREPKDDGVVDPEKTVYTQLIARFLTQNCTSCHSDSKAEGDVMLHSMEAIKAHGEDLIVPGAADKSELYELIVEDDPDFVMPPKGKLQDTNKLELIKWWINTSKTEADLYERKVKDANVPPEFMKLFEKCSKPAAAPAHSTKESATSTKPEQDPVTKPVDKPVDPAALAKVDFVKHIQPIFETTCVKCHGEKKQKGEYRMDTAEHIVKAGESEKAPITKGDASKSYLYTLITLDGDHDDIMPPKGDPLTKAQTDLIKAWIDQGADFPAGLQLKEVDPKAAPKEDGGSTGGGKTDFMKVIAPILEARCIKCHGEKKQKGEYRMDKAEFYLKAGDSEEAPIVKGKPEASYLVKLIKMSEDEDDVMPPKGGNLTAAQIAAIEKWIKEGAEFPAEAALQDKSPAKK